VIGRLEKTVIDCPDPRALAEFYCQVLGMRINEDMDGWVVHRFRAWAAAVRTGERETGFRVFTDPAGHPFCIVFGHHSTD
jgi:catechol 2,3-dioxygenase-like lactoylglutathione lyase family enzyme